MDGKDDYLDPDRVTMIIDRVIAGLIVMAVYTLVQRFL